MNRIFINLKHVILNRLFSKSTIVILINNINIMTTRRNNNIFYNHKPKYCKYIVSIVI